ncbi:MAG: helix-turn-helix domain-containing protein [Tepidisphaerales bacterium]
MRTIAHESAKEPPAGADLPYVMRLPGQRALALTLPADWVVIDKTGEPGLLPPAVRWLDRMRALFSRMQPTPTPGFIRTLREAMNLTQEQFGRRLRVGKMSVSRWERGTMQPGDDAVRAMVRLRAGALRRGLLVDAERR